jgi:hypothetical protein
MTRIASMTAVAAIAVAFALSGCSGGAATPSPTKSAAPVDHTVQASIAGEWVMTRVIASSDDVNNPIHAVAEISKRYVLFGNVVCTDGPCTGAVLSGPTTDVRATSEFASSANTITFDFSGFLNCVDQESGTVLVANGYSYSSHVVLTVKSLDKTDESLATTLEGTLTYTDTVTDEALKAGCTRDPVTATVEYALTAVRASAEDASDQTDDPSLDTTGVEPGGGFGNDGGDN